MRGGKQPKKHAEHGPQVEQERTCPSFLGQAGHICPPDPVHGMAQCCQLAAEPWEGSFYLQGYLFLSSFSGDLEEIGIPMPPQTFLFAI